MSRDFRTLEINVISAESLHINRKQPVKKNAFVTLYTNESHEVSVTNINEDGASYPVWNEKIIMNIPIYSKYFTLEVHCKNYSGDQVLGTVNVPISDFTAAYFPKNYLHFLSYRLRDKKGERNGIINLSVRIKTAEKDTPTTYTSLGIPAKVAHHQGVAMGIPVW